jgi:hypothetical protein
LAFNLPSSDRPHSEPLQTEGLCKWCAGKSGHTARKPLQALDPFFQDWVQLEKIGASSPEERKAMFEAVFSLFDLEE